MKSKKRLNIAFKLLKPKIPIIVWRNNYSVRYRQIEASIN